MQQRPFTNVLVTGGAGFIGSHLVDALVNRGYRVRILDNLSSLVHAGKKPPWLNPHADFLCGDVREKQSWQQALEGVDAVAHLAAYMDYQPDFSTFVDTNVRSIALMFEVIAERQLPVKKILAASSQAVYGDGFVTCATHGRVKPAHRTLGELHQKQFELTCSVCRSQATFIECREDDELHPKNAYGVSKNALEQFLCVLGEHYNILTIAARYSIVQGARQSFRNFYSGVLRTFAVQALAGIPFTVFEDGGQLRDYVNVHDVTNANMLLLENPAPAHTAYNVGGGKAYTVNEFVRIVATSLGVPYSVVPSGVRMGDTRHAVSSIEKLQSLGWQPTRSIEESIQEYFGWVAQFNEAKEYLEQCFAHMKRSGVVR